MIWPHCKNGIVNVTTNKVTLNMRLSDAHYNNSEHHYFKPKVQCSDEFVVIITSRCSDNHHFNLVNNFHYFIKPEPIMLLILPIILSRISHIFHPLFFFYSHAITYYSILIPQI